MTRADTPSLHRGQPSRRQSEPPDRSDRSDRTGITHESYWFAYEGAFDYNGAACYVFRLKPKRKSAGVFNGELWLDPQTGEPLRVWGDLVRSPSIFIRHLRFVQDHEQIGQCVLPRRLLATVQTRIAGRLEMAVWLHSLDSREAENRGCGGCLRQFA